MLILWVKKLVGANFYAFCNYARVPPCESSRPELSENVELIGRVRFLTGVIAAQSQHRAAKVCLSQKISDVTKKRHGHNFEFSGLKRIAGLVHHMSYLGYSFQAQKIKIVAVSFFCDIVFGCRKKLKYY